MADVLAEAGFLVFTAASGDEVLALIETGMRPCLIVCDLLMPGLGVPELVEKLARGRALAARLDRDHDRKPR
jgi:CheY-like chemotaxis protein